MRGVRPAPGPLIERGMVLWFAGTAVLTVWLVFRDPAFDYRLVIVGALLPDVVDAAFGGSAWRTRCVGSVVLLGVVMVVTIGRRSLRRHLIALPIGTFLHLVFDGAFTRTQAFWWPFAGGSWPSSPCRSSSGGLEPPARTGGPRHPGLGLATFRPAGSGPPPDVHAHRPARPDARVLSRSRGRRPACAQLRGCCSSSATAGPTPTRRAAAGPDGLSPGRASAWCRPPRWRRRWRRRTS